MGGLTPVASATLADAIRLAITSLLLSFANNTVMNLVALTFGYAPKKILTADAIDTVFILVGLPYAIALTFAQVTVGWGLLLGLAFMGALMNGIGRRLASATDATRRQLARVPTPLGQRVAEVLDRRARERRAQIAHARLDNHCGTEKKVTRLRGARLP